MLSGEAILWFYFRSPFDFLTEFLPLSDLGDEGLLSHGGQAAGADALVKPGGRLM